MSFVPKILAFAGSTRMDSFNKKLLRAGAQAAREAGAEVTLLDLADLPMPLYDGDLEQREGVPANGIKLKELMKSHQGFLIASPEYNSSISGVLKNAIDWASRPFPGEANLECFADKVAGLLSASPGALGGLRGLVTVRSILGNIGTLVIPRQMALSKAQEAFNPDGSLKDGAQRAAVEKVTEQLLRVVSKLHG